MTSRSTLRRALQLARAALGAARGRAARPEPRADGSRPAVRGRPTAPAGTGYAGDYTGVVRPTYSPHLDGAPDPGEIVWAWVPYEEDHTRGKDRPVLLVGRDGRWLLGLMLTSRDHDAMPPRDRHGRWLDLGSGEWDSRRRPSEVRLDRVLRLDPSAVRREGAVLDAARFALVADSLG